MAVAESEIVARAQASFGAFNRRDWGAYTADVDPELVVASVLVEKAGARTAFASASATDD